MANVENTSNWEKIQKGVKDTERLIGQKQYNMSMVKARQTLEYMVRCMGERACIVDGDLAEMIDQLYQGRWISKTTCEHYHKIRMIGNRAVHEANDNAYEANQAYHILSQEVYTFANDYNGSKGKRPASGGGSGSKAASGGRPSGGRPSTGGQNSNRGRKRTRQQQSGLAIPDLLKILIPVICVIALIIIIVVKPGKGKEKETTAPVTTEAQTESMSEPETTTEAQTESVKYKTTDTLNVRKEPSTTSQKLGVLAPGTEVEFVRKHDDFWAVIKYDGQDGYVANQYLSQE